MLSEWAFGQKRKRKEEKEEERKTIKTNRKASPHFAEKPKKYMSYVCMKQNTGLFRVLKFPMPIGLCAVNEV